MEDIKKCKNCGKQIHSKYNVFCNHSCSASFNNRGVVRNGVAIKKRCLLCGEKLLSNNHKYCSKQCCHQHKWNEFCSEMERTGQLIKTNCDYGYSPHCAKRYLVEKSGHQCVICKNTEWQEQPIPLVLDHINGNPNDNRLLNLRLVCGNCNMLLPTFAGKNKGNGRKNRREKYNKKFGA